MEELKGWSADPSGRHQERYFSDGQPTGLVRDVGRETYDSGQSFPPPSGPIGFAPPATNGRGSAAAARPPAAAPVPPPPAGYADGWRTDPSGLLRYYTQGQPTAWISDGVRVREESAPLTAPDPQPRSPEVDQSLLQSALGDPVSPDEQTARPAGWYRNTSDPNDVRYWDGSGWVGRRSENPDATTGSSVETNGAPPATGQAPALPRPAADLHGWHQDPAGRFRFRWFSSGEATSFVSDGDGRAFDESEQRQDPGSAADESPGDPLASLYSDPTGPGRPGTSEGSPWTVEDDGQPNGASADPVAGPHDDFVSKLERLAALRDSGALTHDEFGMAKQRLLGS